VADDHGELAHKRRKLRLEAIALKRYAIDQDSGRSSTTTFLPVRLAARMRIGHGVSKSVDARADALGDRR
jgi:hypothetical protein